MNTTGMSHLKKLYKKVQYPAIYPVV